MKGCIIFMAILPPSTAPSTSILFPDLNKAANNPRHQDKDLVRDIEDFLNREDIQMTKGRDRLFFVCLNFKQLSFEQAYAILNPDAFRDEFEQTRAYRKWLQFLNILRIFLTLLPLIFTWFSLSLATSAYQQYITKHSNETDPFLTLWQNGFSTNQIPNPEWLTAHLNFSLTAGIDVGILCLLLLANFS